MISSGERSPLAKQDPGGILPGKELLCLVPLAGMALMAANDWLLRTRWPCWLTGKLSDVAGMLFFPFLLTATWSWLLFLGGRILPLRLSPALTRGRLTLAVVASGAALASVKLVPGCNRAFVGLLGSLDVLGLFGRFSCAADPSDCLALAVLPLVWLYGARRCIEPRGATFGKESA
jgi:hypothetical protein